MIEGIEYQWAVRYKFFTYPEGDPNEHKNNKVHLKFIPIDNNHVERILRAIAIGRKNHWGSKSKRGTEAAAIFYSLIGSVRRSPPDMLSPDGVRYGHRRCA